MTGEDAGSGTPVPDDVAQGGSKPGGAREAVGAAEQGVVDVLGRLMETETRAHIYLALRGEPGQTSEEVSEATGLYPSTVRETLAAMTEEGLLSRDKRASDGVGNNPYEYTAIAPGALVRRLVDGLQEDLNTLCNLDSHLHGGRPADREPVRIEVRGDDGEG